MVFFTKIFILNTYTFIKKILPGHNLLKRYGPNSYALITGSTDGIGKHLKQKENIYIKKH